VASILGPVLGGLLSFKFGFAWLFAVSSFLTLASVYPLFKSPEIYTTHRFRLNNFFAIFRRHKQNFFGYWGYAEDLMLMSLWPIVVFGVVKNVLGVGALTTVATVAATVLMLYIGKLSDKLSKRELVQFFSVIYGLTWVFRFVATKVWSIVLFDGLTRIGKGAANVPMVSLTYDLAGSEGPDHAIAYAVFYEFSLSVGKIITALAGIWILSTTGNINYVFVLVGILTMFYGLLKENK
jgi:MFS family permease